MVPGKGSFRRLRVEPLDWRKIASLEIEKILEDTEGTTLREILPQITYCQAELEFDHEKTDPGFRKVFQLSQFIIQYLLESQETSDEKITTYELKCKALMEDSNLQAMKIKTLTDKLLIAKRELKKRKEVIATNQTELLGRNNNDEFDKCPYCSKKFLSSVYLYSHLHRRHQGLPANPSSTSRNQNAMVEKPAESSQPIKIYSVTLSTQTETVDSSVPEPGTPPIDLQTVSQYVEKYLAQKAEESRNKLLPASSPQSDSGTGKTEEIPRKSVEETERQLEAINTVWENHLGNLAKKIENLSIEELTGTIVGELHKMQDIILANNNKTGESIQNKDEKHEPNEVPPVVVASSLSPGNTVTDDGRLKQKQLESLREEARSKSDSGTVGSAIEALERYWKSQFRKRDEDYAQQITRIHDSYKRKELERQKLIPTKQSRGTSPIPFETPRNYSQPSPPASALVIPISKDPSTTSSSSPVPSLPKEIIPVPKPRKPAPQAELESVDSTSGNENSKVNTSARTLVSSHAHEYEEAEGDRNSENVFEYSRSEGSPNESEYTNLRKTKRRKAQHELSPMAAVRRGVLENLSNSMDLFEIPQGTMLLKDEMAQALGRLYNERNSNKQENYAKEREAVKMEAQTSALEKTLEKVETPRRKHAAPPVPVPSISSPARRKINVESPKSPSKTKSPIAKMFQAFKNYDIKQKFPFLRRKPKESRLLIPSQSPKKIQKKSRSFFRRRGNNKSEIGSKQGREAEAAEDDDDSNDEEGSSTTTPPNNSVLVKDRKRRINNRKNRHTLPQIVATTTTIKDYSEDASATEAEAESDKDGGAGDLKHQSHASDISSWRCSELQKNAKEAIKKSTEPIVPQYSLKLSSSRSSSLKKLEDSNEANSASEYSDSRSDQESEILEPASNGASNSDSDAFEKSSTSEPVVGGSEHTAGQYVSPKAPEPEIIVHRPSKAVNEFGFPISIQYTDDPEEPDFFTSTPIRNPPEKHRSLSPDSEGLSSTSKRYESATHPQIAAERTTCVSDWDESYDHLPTPDDRPDFVIPTPKKLLPDESTMQPKSSLQTPSPKKAGGTAFSSGSTLVSPQQRPMGSMASPLKKGQPLWSLSAPRPPTADTRNTKHKANSSPRDWNRS